MVNQAHWHFIHVLTKVVEILARPGIELLESRFAVLSVDDTADIPDDAELDQQDADQEVDMNALEQRQQSYRAEDDDGEVLLSLFCFFNDIDRVRTFLKETWTQYRDGTLDLVTASLVTSTAMDLVRQAQADLLAYHPRTDQYHEIIDRFFLQTCILRGLPPAPLDPADMVNPEMADIAEFILLPVHATLNDFKPVIVPGSFPALRKGHFGVYDPLVDRSRLSLRDRLQEDRLILQELMPELVFLERKKTLPPACDTLSEEFSKFAHTKAETPILVFAAQVFLDIHAILREQVDRGLHELQSTGTSILASIDAYHQHKHRASSPKWTPTHELGVKRLRDDIDFWVMHDPYLPEKKRLFLSNISRAPPASARTWQDHLNNLSEFALLNKHPWLCGLLQFRIALAAHDVGLAMADNWGTILYTGHLYEAGKIGGWIKCTPDATQGDRIGPWDDMEFVMMAHGKEKLFRGRVPNTLQEAYTSAQLMLGLSGVDLVAVARGNARSKRGGKGKSKVSASSDGPVGLGDPLTVCSVFRERFLFKEPAHVSVAGVEALISSMVKDQATAQVTGACDPTHQDKPLSYLQRMWRKSHTLTPLQLLQALRAVLAREHNRLHFDYIRMHVRCVKALRAVHQEVDERLKRYLYPKYFRSEEQLAWIPAYVLFVSSGTERFAEYVKSPAAKATVRTARKRDADGQDSSANAVRAGVSAGESGNEGGSVGSKAAQEGGDQDNVHVGSRILRDASNVLQEWIRVEGDVERQALKSLVSASLELAGRPRPPLREPTRLWAWQNASFNGRRVMVTSEQERDHRHALMAGTLDLMDEMGLQFNPERFEEVGGAGGFESMFTADEARAMMAAHQQRRLFAQLNHELNEATPDGKWAMLR
ncbi:hypothetical protein BCR44DRAFT_1435871 [Catenaria anguillulae PL171]|uniref:DUF6604 domain-containing protein n=1 Tax=Catenaria anguillulae PL171 TaxID=765915 RepID=A0A1Y2HJP5_9FUNG|nr:hypothetical protein BCR44DRAFT_1435871 [Catenaria anguillulae PL171]